MRFTARQRLRRTKDFQSVRRSGQRIDVGAFWVQATIAEPAEREPAVRRLGVIASRRVGKAVKRNRAKRIFRELFRLHQQALPPSCEIVIVARSNFDRHSFHELEHRYLGACRKLRHPRRQQSK